METNEQYLVRESKDGKLVSTCLTKGTVVLQLAGYDDEIEIEMQLRRNAYDPALSHIYRRLNRKVRLKMEK